MSKPVDGEQPGPWDRQEHRVLTPDGWTLNVLQLTPAAPPRACVLLGHAMMVDRRTLFRPDKATLAEALLHAGFLVFVVDLRGHGTSGPRADEGGQWSYEDLVSDTGTLLQFARNMAPELPLFTVGHSLFGHTAMAYLGQHPESPVSGHVAMGVNIWNRRFEANTLRWAYKRLQVAIGTFFCTLLGRVPARRFRAGTADEPSRYWNAVRDWVGQDRWASPDGVDYHEGLRNIRCPVLHVVSEGDRWLGAPKEAIRFAAPLGDKAEILRVGPQCKVPKLTTLTPDHMEMVTDEKCAPIWHQVAEWIGAQIH
jgi:predicted alpha/beta hydrolase